jgi:hypothetical protein
VAANLLKLCGSSMVSGTYFLYDQTLGGKAYGNTRDVHAG